MKSHLKHPMFPLSFLILIDHIGYGILFPILVPVFMEGHGILGPEASPLMKSFWYNVTLSVFPVTLFFGATLLGSLSDHFGRKKILTLCLIGATLSYFLGALAIDLSHVPLLIFSRMLAGITAGSMPIAQAAIIDISRPEERTTNLSLVILVASLGFLLGPMIGGFFSDGKVAESLAYFLGPTIGGFISTHQMVSWFSFSTPFYVASTLALINLGFLSCFFKESYVPKKSEKLEVFISASVELLLAPFKNKNIRFLSLIYFLIQLGWGFYFQFISVFLLKRYQYSSQDISIFMSLMGIGFALGSCLVLRMLLKYFQERVVALCSLCIVVAVAFIMVLGIPPELNWLGSLVLGIFMAIVYSLMVTFYSKTVSEEKQGWIMGVSESVIAVAWAISPLASIYLEHLDLALPLQLASLLLALGTALFIFWREPVLDRPQEGPLWQNSSLV